MKNIALLISIITVSLSVFSQKRDMAVGLIKTGATQVDVSAILTLLRNNNVKYLDWSSTYPNLNVIENLWDEL